MDLSALNNELNEVDVKNILQEPMKNLIIASIIGLEENNEEVQIVFEDGSKIKMYHVQDCCESVYVAQVDGQVERHIGARIKSLKEKISEDQDGMINDSCTWTFYDLVTSKGILSFRFNGESNGYYSESVDIEYIDEDGTHLLRQEVLNKQRKRK